MSFLTLSQLFWFKRSIKGELTLVVVPCGACGCMFMPAVSHINVDDCTAKEEMGKSRPSGPMPTRLSLDISKCHGDTVIGNYTKRCRSNVTNFITNA